MSRAESIVRQSLAFIAGLIFFFSMRRTDPLPILLAYFSAGVLLVSLPVWLYLLGQYVDAKRRKQRGFDLKPLADPRAERSNKV